MRQQCHLLRLFNCYQMSFARAKPSACRPIPCTESERVWGISVFEIFRVYSNFECVKTVYITKTNQKQNFSCSINVFMKNLTFKAEEKVSKILKVSSIVALIPCLSDKVCYIVTSFALYTHTQIHTHMQCGNPSRSGRLIAAN